MIKSIRNLISINILAFIGYIYLYFLIIHINSFLNSYQESLLKPEPYFMALSVSIRNLSNTIGLAIFSLIHILIFSLISFFEYSFQKKYIIPTFNIAKFRFHKQLFYLGLSFNILPILYILILGIIFQLTPST